MFEPGGISEPEHKTMFLDVLESYILTSTLILDCILFATETPITVEVVLEATDYLTLRSNNAGSADIVVSVLEIS